MLVAKSPSKLDFSLAYSYLCKSNTTNKEFYHEKTSFHTAGVLHDGRKGPVKEVKGDRNLGPATTFQLLDEPVVRKDCRFGKFK